MLTRALRHTVAGCLVYLSVSVAAPAVGPGELRFRGLQELNIRAAPADSRIRAIVGAVLIDGRGGPVVPDAAVIVRGNKIVAAGPRREISVPEGADVFDASGMSVLPGLMDAHLHVSRGALFKLPALWLSHGVTSTRDPGGVEVQHYAPLSKEPKVPRLFSGGRHFDQAPVAYPGATELYSAEDTRAAVARYVREGATSIKVYFRLPLDLVRVTCDAAHASGIPVTAHLELLDAGDAILAGLDGIEHITSFGVAIAAPEAADSYRRSIGADNAFRWNGRFRLWSELQLDGNPRVQRLIEILLARRTFVSSTLGLFECRAGDTTVSGVKKVEDYHVRGFANMLKFAGILHRAGVTFVVGTDTRNRHSELGWAPHQEMELFVEAGMTPVQAITAATLNNARFLGCHERLGSIEPGKLADLVLVEGDASKDIKALYRPRRVMLDGGWIEAQAKGTPSSAE